MIRVVLADDHHIVREGVRRVLENEPDMRVLAEAASGQEVLTVLSSAACDVLVLDLAMPGRHGRELFEEIRRAHPKLGLVIFTMYPEDPLALHFLRGGAHAYVSKEREPADLIEAIRLAARGKCYLPSPLTVCEPSDPAEPARASPSSAHRYQALFLALEGLSPEEIGRELLLPADSVQRLLEGTHEGEATGPLLDLVRSGARGEAGDSPGPRRLLLGPVDIDLSEGMVRHPAGPRTLGRRELVLLEYLVAHVERTISKEELLSRVWEYSPLAQTRTVEMAVSRLRRKIELQPAQPRYLLTIHGEGYRLVLDPSGGERPA